MYSDHVLDQNKPGIILRSLSVVVVVVVVVKKTGKNGIRIQLTVMFN